MGFLKKIFRKKVNEENNSKDLLTRLDDKGIIYSLVDTNEGYQMTYLDVFDKERYIILKKEDKYKLNGKNLSENEIAEILENQNRIDNKMETLLYDPDNDKLIQIYEFFKQIDIIYTELSVTRKDELSLSFSCPEAKPFTSIHIDHESKKIVYDHTNEILGRNNTVIRLIEDIKEKMPLFFDSGGFIVPEQTPFTDTVRTYMLNYALVERLNKTKNVEAKLIDVAGNTMVFIIFKNGAAVEYMSATKQNPTGKLLLIDVDEDTTLEDNEEYWLVQKILKLPACLQDKPDEENMPIRKFTNKKA